MSRALAELLYRWRRILCGVIIAGAVLLAPRANITDIDNDLTAWFSRADPIYQEYERFSNEFGGTRTLIVALEAPSRDRLESREALEAIDAISRAIEHVEAVDRVSSLTTATVIDARPPSRDGDDTQLDVRPLIDDLATHPPAAVVARARDDALLRGDLVSEDGTVASIIVFFDESKIDEVRGRVLDEIRTVVNVSLPAGFTAYYNGSLEITETYNRITLDNQSRFVPPIFALTILALFVMFRSWRQTVLTMGAVAVSLLWTLGLYDLLGLNYNVLSSMIVPLVVVLAIADDVHIIQHYGEARRTRSPEEAFKHTVRHLAAPLLGASGTTALGMMSLATSEVVAVREFGIGAAVGVMVDYGISLVLMPTILGWLKPETRQAPQESWFTMPLARVARFSTRRAGLVMAVTVLLTGLAIAGLFRLRVDTNHISFFSANHPLGRSARVIDSKLSGIYTFQVLLEGPADSLRDPDALVRMQKLEDELRAIDQVKKVTGLADYVARIHHELTGAPAGTLPTDPAAAAQELFVFSLADEGRVELERVAASDFSKAQITVKLPAMSSDVLFDLIGTAEREAAEAFTGTPIKTTVTGSGRLFSTLDHYLVLSQLSSFATAFVTVFGVIFIVFRSWRFGVLAIVPNLIPVLAIFGVMGWIGISLNVVTIMLASVALGVVDDDTIHFISRYRHETADGADTDEAILAATTHEGRAALTTAIINSCAFAVLLLSEYRPTAWFGGLLSLTMVAAFLAEIFILPATITLMPVMFGASRVHGRATRPGAATK